MSSARLLFCLSLALIFAMGMLMVFNTSAADVLDKGRAASTHAALTRQLLYAMAGAFLAAVVWSIGSEGILRLSPLLTIVVVICLALVFVPGIGQVHNGARRWIGIGRFSFQPSELAKFILPLFALHLLQDNPLKTWRGWCGVALVMGAIVLVLLEPDKGTAGILGLTILAVLILARIRLRYWLLPMTALLLVGGIAALRSPYVIKRMMVYLDPEADLLGTGHQPYQARIAAGSGGFWGKGAGQSLQKLSYLPEAQNDYIAAIFAEEFGFAGVATLILLYLLMTASGLTLAQSAATVQGMRIAAVLTFMIAVQAFFNLGVVSGIVPTTGLNLPFFSQGGTSLVTNMVAAGLILSGKSHGFIAHYHRRWRDRGALGAGPGTRRPAT